MQYAQKINSFLTKPKKSSIANYGKLDLLQKCVKAKNPLNFLDFDVKCIYIL